jgi:hypothetical protein
MVKWLRDIEGVAIIYSASQALLCWVCIAFSPRRRKHWRGYGKTIGNYGVAPGRNCGIEHRIVGAENCQYIIVLSKTGS